MAAPSVELRINAGKISLQWDLDTSGTYAYYNLYWDTSSTMAGEAKFASNVPNRADGTYSNKQVIYDFNRSALPVTESTAFYVRSKGVSAAGVEDAANPSATKYIPAVNEVAPERQTVMYGWDPTTNTWRPVMVQKDATSIAGKLDTV